MQMTPAVAMLILTALLAGCTAEPGQVARHQPGDDTALAQGTVVQIGRDHGNLYTSIRPDRYPALSVAAGDTVTVAFDHTEVTMRVGRDYTDVPPGEPVAVLHREGLTFAIRDGDFSDAHGVAAGDRFTLRAADAR